VSSTNLTAQSVSGSGSCSGDSGGPLIIRDDTGAPSAIGLLSNGSAGCNQTDAYLRTDILASWVLQTIGALTSDDGSCAGLSAEGRCFSGTAAWCDPNRNRVAQRCDDSGKCGWSTEEQGYRCVTSDPCSGIDALGTCVGASVVKRCDKGQLTSQDCGLCAAMCQISGSDSSASCVSAQGGR
jgi:hypothetical protein